MFGIWLCLAAVSPPLDELTDEIVLTDSVCFIFAYLVWLIEEWACGSLTSTRHSVGVPLAFLLELHG